MSCAVGRALAGELCEVQAALRPHPLHIASLLVGGVIRLTPTSRHLAAVQRSSDGPTVGDLDAAFAELRSRRSAVAALDALRATDAHVPRRRRRADLAYGVGQLVFHRGLRERCVVNGWEVTTDLLGEVFAPVAALVDNRRSFYAGALDAAALAPDAPHYRCLFADGTARACAEANLADPGLTDLAKIRGSSFFFKAADAANRRLVPREGLEALYPEDAAHARAALHDASTAAHSVHFLRSWRTLGEQLGDEMFDAGVTITDRRPADADPPAPTS